MENFTSYAIEFPVNKRPKVKKLLHGVALATDKRGKNKDGIVKWKIKTQLDILMLAMLLSDTHSEIMEIET